MNHRTRLNDSEINERREASRRRLFITMRNLNDTGQRQLEADLEVNAHRAFHKLWGRHTLADVFLDVGPDPMFNLPNAMGWDCPD